MATNAHDMLDRLDDCVDDRDGLAAVHGGATDPLSGRSRVACRNWN